MFLKIKKIKTRIYIFLVATLGLPLVSFAGSSAPVACKYTTSKGLIVCDGPDCDFNSLICLFQVLIDFMVIFSTVAAAIVLAIAGFRMMTAHASGNPGNVSKARTMMAKIVIGYVVILASWLIVHTILGALVKPEFSLLG